MEDMKKRIQDMKKVIARFELLLEDIEIMLDDYEYRKSKEDTDEYDEVIKALNHLVR